MKTFKILIYGVSGDYAQRKILPSIGQFHSHYGNMINIEVVGYSRSKVTVEEVRRHLQYPDKNPLDTVPNTISPIHITLETGQYDDISFFTSHLERLQQDEKLVCYLALPPHVYLPFLKQVCLISSRDYTILIEKPFGRNKKESEEIFKTIAQCNLYNHVYFVDHYLFKSGARLPLSQVVASYDITCSDIQSIEIEAMETIGVEGRVGYYDQTGAFLDMYPHTYSLFQLVMKSLSIQPIPSLWDVRGYTTAQYDGYIQDLLSYNDTSHPSLSLKNTVSSDTETFFSLEADAYVGSKKFAVTFSSGKKQPQKKTHVTVKTALYTIQLSLAPHNSITVFNANGDVIQVIPALDSFIGDHERMFKDLLEQNFTYFIPADKIISYWDLPHISNTLNQKK